MNNFMRMESFEGLFPLYLGSTEHDRDFRVSFGGLGDSFYEYLLKQWLLTNRTDDNLKQLYLDCVEGLVKNLIVQSKKSKKKFVAEWSLSNKAGKL